MGLKVARLAGYVFAASLLSVFVFIFLLVLLGGLFLSSTLGIFAFLVSFIIVKAAIKIE